MDTGNQQQGKSLVFISYAREDNKSRASKRGWLDWLLCHIEKPFKQAGIELFIDNTIITGEYTPAIKDALDRATAAILLLSPDFMNSDYIIEKELPVLITRYKAKQLEFFPLLISPCSWDLYRIAYPDPVNNNHKAHFILNRLLLTGHDPEHPLDSLPEYEVNKVFKEVTKRILTYHAKREEQPILEEQTVFEEKNREKKQEQKEPIKKEVKEVKEVKKASYIQQKPGWASGIENDEYGKYADIKIKGITQRMRWIEPGEFLMGSPSGEPERSDNEFQHRVILPKGFWFADTACTQALWQAVMKTNRSEFKGSLLPVEMISWEMSREFIGKCNSLIPGLALRLPTEAEWEYACRAGTTTPFFFGENINTDQVNYAGNYPYNNGKKGEYREKTVEVKSLPCNSWGLYQMHGNVWEWCADWYGEYTGETVTNPQGPEKGVLRVLRGGGWFDDAWFTRSACRDRVRPSIRSNYVGFRLARGQG